jgi:hypothetical protein
MIALRTNQKHWEGDGRKWRTPDAKEPGQMQTQVEQEMQQTTLAQ